MATGYIQVHVFTSNSQIPLENTAIAITDLNDSAIALRLTNRSGGLDNLIAISVPELSASQTPNTGIQPFTQVNIHARKTGYEQIEVNKVQVFADTVTLQNFEMIPISEFPDSWNQTELFSTPIQNL